MFADEFVIRSGDGIGAERFHKPKRGVGGIVFGFGPRVGKTIGQQPLTEPRKEREQDAAERFRLRGGACQAG